MSTLVMKFGGTSVADLTRIKAVAKIIQDTCSNGNQVVAVVVARRAVAILVDQVSLLVDLIDQANHLVDLVDQASRLLLHVHSGRVAP